jgi:hypothetical protein
MAYLTKNRQAALDSHLKGAVRRNRLHQALAAGEVITVGSSLFSVVFKPVGFIGFHTVTKVGFSGHPDVARGLLGWGPISERSCSAVVRGCLPPINVARLDAVGVYGGPALRWFMFAAVRVCGRGAFGEIALPRRCLDEVDFSATRM